MILYYLIRVDLSSSVTHLCITVQGVSLFQGVGCITNSELLQLKKGTIFIDLHLEN